MPSPVQPMDKEEVARAFAWTSGLMLATKVALPIVTTGIVARLLGPGPLGVFAIAAGFLAAVDILREFGLSATFIADVKCPPGDEGRYVGLAAFVGVAYFAVIASAANPLASLLGVPQYGAAIAALGFCGLLGSLGSIVGAKVQKTGRFRRYAVSELAAQIASSIAVIALAWAGFGVWALVVGAALRQAAMVAMFWSMAPLLPALPDAAFLKRVFPRSVGMVSNNVLSVPYTMADSAFIGRAFGKEAAGLYNAAFALAMKPVELISWPLSRTLLVALSHRAESPERVASAYIRVLSAVALIVVPGLFVLAMNPGAVMALVYGEKFRAAAPMFTVLCLYLGFRAFGTIGGTVLASIGRPAFANFAWLGAYALVAILAVTGYATRSAWHAAWALTMGAILAYGFSAVAVFILIRPKAADFRPLKLAALACAPSIAAVAFLAYLGLSPLVGLTTSVLAGTLIQLVSVGAVLTGSPLSGFHPAGLRQIWTRL